MNNLFELGYPGLFLASFMASTVIPFSSELILSAMIFGGYDVALSLFLATLGNWMGSMSSYTLGYLCKWNWIEKYLRVKQEKILNYGRWVRKFGFVMAFFSWLPFIGDLFPIVLGVFRTRIWSTTLLILIGKAFRYLIWAYLTLKVIKNY
jgi:membrane protein YqaA with SNARE-associated domain